MSGMHIEWRDLGDDDLYGEVGDDGSHAQVFADRDGWTMRLSLLTRLAGPGKHDHDEHLVLSHYALPSRDAAMALAGQAAAALRPVHQRARELVTGRALSTRAGEAGS